MEYLSSDNYGYQLLKGVCFIVRKIFILFIAMAILSGCSIYILAEITDNVTSKTESIALKKPVREINQNRRSMNELDPDWLPPIYDKTKTLEELLPDFVISDETAIGFVKSALPLSLNTIRTLAVDFNESLPIEFFIKVNDNTYYTVYETESGGLLYQFFSNGSNNIDKPRLGYRMSILSIKKLAYSDFGTVKIGSPISEVRAVDPSAENFFHSYELSEGRYSYTTIHLMTDGLLKITYEETEGKDGFIISKVEHYEDYIYPSPNPNEPDINCRVFGLDLIDK